LPSRRAQEAYLAYRQGKTTTEEPRGGHLPRAYTAVSKTITRYEELGQLRWLRAHAVGAAEKTAP
jgi:hypothetical protein